MADRTEIQKFDPLQASYLGMSLQVAALDPDNQAYFRYCAEHDFHLQRCCGCKLLRYPPMASCPWCAGDETEWIPVDGRGEVHTYSEVHHAVQPGFADHLPYLVLIVDLDVQKGQPSSDEALRVVGNLVDPEGKLVSGGGRGAVGIGTRVRLVFTDVAPGLALPQWTVDESAHQPAAPWQWRD